MADIFDFSIREDVTEIMNYDDKRMLIFRHFGIHCVFSILLAAPYLMQTLRT
jgi:hypothetical protein